MSPKVLGTQNGGTVPYKAFLGVGCRGFPYISQKHTAYIGESFGENGRGGALDKSR